MPTQLVDIPKAMTNIPTRKSIATHELYFAVHLEPVSYKSFYIQKFKYKRRSTSSGDRSIASSEAEQSSEHRKRRYDSQHNKSRSTSGNGQQRKRRSLYNEQLHKRRSTTDNGQRRKRRSLYNYEQPQIYPVMDFNLTNNHYGDTGKYFRVGLKHFPRRNEIENFEVDIKDQLDDKMFNFKNQVSHHHRHNKPVCTHYWVPPLIFAIRIGIRLIESSS